MKVSVERLRWGLAAAVVLLLAGLVGLVSYGRYAAAKKWKDILARNGIHITRESDNVTYSQTVQGRTVFTIRAKKAIPLADGKYTLRGVTLLLYGKNADNVDRVEGDEFEYDEKAGVAKAIGDVHMDIQAPGALKRKTREGAAAGAPAGGDLDQERDVIHVLTSGLVYLRKLGVAATDQRVEFRYAGLTCVSKGAEFETEESVLHLLADVELSGVLHGQPAVVHAAKADLDRDRNTIAVQQPVASTSARGGQETGRAANAVLLLRPDGSLEHANAWGGVLLETPQRHVRAARLEAAFAPANVPESAVLSGGVTLDGSAAKPMHGAAAEADLSFTPAGAVGSVVGKGGVRLAGNAVRPAGPSLAREMRGDQVTAKFGASGGGKQAMLQEVHATGSASVRSEAFATTKPAAKGGQGGAGASGIVTTQMAADDLLAVFTAPAGKDKQPALRHLTGQGHTRVQRNGLGGAEEVSSGDTLEAAFAPGTIAGPAAANRADAGSGIGLGGGSVRLQSVVQAGHVQIRDQAAAQANKRGALSLAHADRAAFDGSTERLVLTGGAAYQQEGTSLSADAISVAQGSGDAEAQGHVEASLDAADRAATHVLADRARLTRSAQTAEFFGTDAHPARMWQANSQVSAANLYLDDGRQSLSARPAAAGAMVEAVFATESRGEKPGGGRASGGSFSAGSVAPKLPAGAVGEAAHVSCPALSYSGLRHEAVCAGGAQLRQGDVQVRSRQVVVFLAAAAPSAKPQAGSGGSLAGAGVLGGSLERMVFSGNVRLDEPGRAGDGEQLVYAARDGSYLLTGTAARPPRVADAERGMVTGPALLFRSGEKSVIVTGTSASNGHEAGPPELGGHVHTELNVRPQPR